ncbi:MAG: hypothetical protein KC615_07635 [Anaerolineae bacterium]|nr:hypothetical protein [Anaerolineae bacterium]MCA9892840.1 hypothetical protein [Anaerolineae bacterium]MCB9461257.1 hypothetical protein [Anaerolineaceae bacterium]
MQKVSWIYSVGSVLFAVLVAFIVAAIAPDPTLGLIIVILVGGGGGALIVHYGRLRARQSP